MKKRLSFVREVLPLLVLFLFLGYHHFSYAGNLSTENMNYAARTAPEMIIHEEDLTHDEYRDSLRFLTEILDKYREGNKKEIGWEYENIGVQNHLLIVEGYGLKAQRDIARLELKNAGSNGAVREKLAAIGSKLEIAEKQLKNFLEQNVRVD